VGSHTVEVEAGDVRTTRVGELIARAVGAASLAPGDPLRFKLLLGSSDNTTELSPFLTLAAAGVTPASTLSVRRVCWTPPPILSWHAVRQLARLPAEAPFSRAAELDYLDALFSTQPTSVLILSGPPSCGKSGACSAQVLRCQTR
jgi:hypothetical protein